MAATDTLAVAFRMPDGRVTCRERSLGPARHWLRDIRILQGDEATIEGYVNLGGPAPDAPVRPAGIGLYVLDLAGGELLTLLDGFDPLSFEASLFGRFPSQQMVMAMTPWAEAGRLRLRRRRPGRPDEVGEALAPEGVLAAGVRLLGERATAGEVEDAFVVDAPLRHAGFPATPGGADAMRAALAAGGFDPAPGWDEWLEARAEPARSTRARAARRA
jgi:hypothetical protein